MPISLDNSTSGGRVTAATSLTFAHICSGNNRLLFVAVQTSSASDPTGITYGGISMTKLLGGIGNGLGTGSLWYLISPNTGSNNVVITMGAAVNITGASISYIGAKQSGVPDASASIHDDAAPGTTITQSVTPIADKCWVMSMNAVRDDAAITLTAGTGVTSRQVVSNLLGIGDSNGLISPPASTSMSWNKSSAIGSALIMASFAPAANVGLDYAQLL